MTSPHTHRIGFIGAGNMAHCLMNGLIANDYPARLLWASHPQQERVDFLQQKFAIQVTLDNKIVAENADIIVLCVKPQVMDVVAKEIAPIVVRRQSLVISIAAGINTNTLHHHLGKNVAIVRCMPNLPAFVSAGSTGLFATTQVTAAQRDIAESILRAVGVTLWVSEERLIDVVAALSGSGPAYFFYVMDALAQAAVELGLPSEDARLLCVQTALGAARLALADDESFSDLRARVTSKKGITEKALEALNTHHTHEALQQALQAAYKRSQEIAQEFQGGN